jgi:hypothetical protein
MHRTLIEARPIAPGADVKRIFIAAMLEFIDAGWQLGDFSSRLGEFYCTRGAERVSVAIEAIVAAS